MDFALFTTFLILVGLELVLGIDNIIMVSMIADRCPEPHREMVRKLGILLAAAGRLVLLFGITWLLKLTAPVVHLFDMSLSWKDIILLAGGAFLLFKAVKEIHHTVTYPVSHEAQLPSASISVMSGILQILALDLVFSIDSVITAVGLTQVFWVMASAILISIACIFIISGPIIRFIRANPALKVLALSFLVVIGVVIIMEGLHHHVPKSLIYLPLGFCLVVEMLQMYQAKRLARDKA